MSRIDHATIIGKCQLELSQYESTRKLLKFYLHKKQPSMDIGNISGSSAKCSMNYLKMLEVSSSLNFQPLTQSTKVQLVAWVQVKKIIFTEHFRKDR